jgi:ketosteroid isomerase-like protein
VKKRIQIPLVLVLTSSPLVFVSCGPSGRPDSRASDVSTLRALDEQWSATAAKNDLDGTVAFYADNAVLLPPNAPIATDGKSIRDSWAGLLGPNTAISWKVSKAEVASSGELGYVYGTYSLAIKDAKGGPPVRDTGKFVEIWKKRANGEWKCVVDTYNSDLPAAPTAEPKH